MKPGAIQGNLDSKGVQIDASGYTVLRFGKDGAERYIKAADLKQAVELVTK